MFVAFVWSPLDTATLFIHSSLHICKRKERNIYRMYIWRFFFLHSPNEETNKKQQNKLFCTCTQPKWLMLSQLNLAPTTIIYKCMFHVRCSMFNVQLFGFWITESTNDQQSTSLLSIEHNVHTSSSHTPNWHRIALGLVYASISYAIDCIVNPSVHILS